MRHTTKKNIIATLLQQKRPDLANVVAKLVTAKKMHFDISSFAQSYEDEVAVLAENNYGPWSDTAHAEQHVHRAIQDYAKSLHDDVIESFNENDIKYIVEKHLYADDPDPYGMDPADPKVKKALEKFAKDTFGNSWASYAFIQPAAKAGVSDRSSTWAFAVEGYEGWDYSKGAMLIQSFLRKNGYKNAAAEPYDHVTIVVYPDGSSE